MAGEVMWSESRIKTFRECPLKYHYHYHVADQGWTKNAPTISKKAYVLKKINNLHMLVGSIVHDTIERMIGNRWLEGDNTEFIESAIKEFNDKLDESKNKQWKKSATKFCNLFEDYYGSGVSTFNVQKFTNKIRSCLNLLFTTQLWKRIEQLNNSDFLEMEQFSTLVLKNGGRAYVKIDFAFKMADKVVLVDWKTGKPNPGIKEQLLTYGMYALKMGWIKRVDDLIIQPVFLGANKPSEILPTLNIQMEDMIRHAELIKKESDVILKLEQHKKDDAFFEARPSEKKCTYCNFKEICQFSQAE